MSSATLKLLVISLILLLVSASFAFYTFYQQEKNGETIRQSFLRFKVWEELNRGEIAKDDEVVKGREAVHALVLSSENETVKLLALIDEVAVTSGVEIIPTGLEVKKTRESGFNDLAVSLSIRGSRDRVERVVELLELLPFRSNIVNLTLVRSVNNLATADVSLLVSIKE